jgi:hypothetical protein
MASAIIPCLVTYPLGMIFHIPIEVFRELYWTIILEPGLKILKDWEENNKGNFCRNLWGLFIHIIIYLLAFFISFGFCTVYQYQLTTWIFMLIAAIVWDFLILEIIWELIIAIFYSLRKKSRIYLRIGEFINRTRNYKCLT